MRIAALLVFILFFDTPLRAQDTTRISYTEVQDTLVKQRFIDRYENVFMTKVPTRHMFKVGISQYNGEIVNPLFEEKLFPDLSLQVGYEFKFLPAFSVALSGHLPSFGDTRTLHSAWSNVLVDAQLRWYVDMKRRIKSGKSANNFSGNYVALNYNLPGTASFSPRIGLKFGIQRRFFNSGFLDFALALHQEGPWFHYGLLENWSFSTQASLGFAFGDWKRNRNPPFCDVLLCEENIDRQWKVKLPELTFGQYLSRIRAGLAYEHRIKNAPVTLNFQLDLGLNKGYTQMLPGLLKDVPDDVSQGFSRYFISREATFSFSIQPRYYFLQEWQKMKGRPGNGMSSLYTGINLENNFYTSSHGVPHYISVDEQIKIKQNTLHVGPMIGFQQRVFKNGYIDINTSYNYKREFYKSQNTFGFRGNLAVGLAF